LPSVDTQRCGTIPAKEQPKKTHHTFHVNSGKLVTKARIRRIEAGNVGVNGAKADDGGGDLWGWWVRKRARLANAGRKRQFAIRTHTAISTDSVFTFNSEQTCPLTIIQQTVYWQGTFWHEKYTM
jgi:hypothetical protein